MKNLIIITFFLLIAATTYSQDFDVPKSYSFEKAKDYTGQNHTVIKAVDWLENTPLTQDTSKRKEVNAFLMAWLSGSPDVSIDLSGDIVTFMDCGDCLVVFMGGWAKYALVNKDYNNTLKGNIAGIESTISFYQKNKNAIGKTKAIEKYIKQKDKGTLEDYIKSKI